MTNYREAAESMAVIVAKWRLEHNIDGIDLDIEAGAGDQQVGTTQILVTLLKRVIIFILNTCRRLGKIWFILSENSKNYNLT